MRVYLFDSVTFKYAGFYDCQESPLELGVYITPTDSTSIEPPYCPICIICQKLD